MVDILPGSIPAKKVSGMTTLRTASPRDIPGITAIYAHWVTTGTATFELESPSEAEMLKRYEAIISGGYPYLVAEVNGTIQGYAYANAYRPRPAYRFTVEDSIYVAPGIQRSGVGRLLLARLIDDCTARDFRQMIAVIGDSRQMSSIQVHRACGFSFAGTMHAVGYKFGRWIDAVVMQRPLGAGDTAPPR
jgi:L-amino acid N-acyltransferase YncA